VSSKTSVGPSEVLTMVRAGVDERVIVQELIETGVWSRSGAADIVRFMTTGAEPPPGRTALAPTQRNVR
jgi:hypothetical protein